MQTSDLVLVRGLADTRAKLAVWNARPGPVVGRNLLVLARHAMACVAGFIAGSSQPLVAWMIASRRRDWHELLAATVVTVIGDPNERARFILYSG